MITPKGYDGVFSYKKKVGSDAYSFYFKRPEGFKYNPGQYIKLILKQIKKTDERGNFRYFTLSSSPTEGKYLTITTRIIKSTFKKKLSVLKEDELVRIFGPLDGVDFDPSDRRQRVYLAGGIGITPARSIIHFLSDKKLKIPFVLLSSFKNLKDHIFLDELKNIEKQNNWFKFIVSITKKDKKWAGHTGRIDSNLIKKNVKNIKSSVFIVTGPAQMVSELSSQLEKLGISKKNIQKETFPGY